MIAIHSKSTISAAGTGNTEIKRMNITKTSPFVAHNETKSQIITYNKSRKYKRNRDANIHEEKELKYQAKP